ncbi:E3 ubiquitin-protein ligase rififylin-like [Lingula anatina]|uniref:E3 ubiquitin-protein ligase rififylin-like n=1 Tax=Lingula anatina TaxID=7574 RepID=A0A1S3J524_LINAN|nr:E3 ubiquitin-protein ligase rififylin-like [Lingula anatina]|eukprot:XP_013405366.1 E3 ubiquitin-protein ligase rififylin-like [Lingula anatina]
MGAGAVRGAQGQPQSQGQNKVDSSSQLAIMSCEKCGAVFGLLKRKRICLDCGNYHCSACLTRVTFNKRRCQLCQMFASKQFDRQTLMDLRLKDLKVYLNKHVIQYQRCTEKNDLVELILRHSGNQSYLEEQEEHRRHLEVLKEHRLQNEVQDDRESVPSSDESSSEHIEHSDTHSTVPPPEPTPAQPTHSEQSPPTQLNHQESDEERNERLRRRQEQERRNLEERIGNDWFMDSDEEPDPRAPRVRMRLSAIDDIEQIDTLSPRQLKELLAANFVDYKGCVEKWELVDKAKRLWQSHKENQKKAEEIHNLAEKQGNKPSATRMESNPEDSLCKICMDHTVDCVLLECGHSVTCTNCGKRMSECPICRQYVVRAVRIFKS